MTDIVYLYKDTTQGWTTCSKDSAVKMKEEYNRPIKRVDMDNAEELEVQDRLTAVDD